MQTQTKEIAPPEKTPCTYVMFTLQSSKQKQHAVCYANISQGHTASIF